MEGKSRSLLWAILIIVAIFGILYFFSRPDEEITPPVATPTPTSAPANDLQITCETAGGTWLAEYNECENINDELCTSLSGEFNECGSACRHADSDEPVPCTLQCVQFCSFN